MKTGGIMTAAVLGVGILAGGAAHAQLNCPPALAQFGLCAVLDDRDWRGVDPRAAQRAYNEGYRDAMRSQHRYRRGDDRYRYGRRGWVPRDEYGYPINDNEYRGGSQR